VIAAVHGYALGAGCEFALCSDLVIAGEGAEFGFPEVGVGLTVTGGISHVLPTAVGLVRAKELVLTGHRFAAEQALSWGLVNRVVPDDAVLDEATKMATDLANRPRAALALAKRALDSGAAADLEQALGLEVEHAVLSMASADAAVAAATFRQRAEP
jgi:enoyl-CoA hydratase/carnithine racemase